MSSSARSHARSHALLLLQKLLNLRDSASPLTLVLDTLEQSAKPLIGEFLSRAKVRTEIHFTPFQRFSHELHSSHHNLIFYLISHTSYCHIRREDSPLTPSPGLQIQNPLPLPQHPKKAPQRRHIHPSTAQDPGIPPRRNNLSLPLRNPRARAQSASHNRLVKPSCAVPLLLPHSVPV